MSTTSHKSRGFSVPTAIFIIVILAALGAFMVTIGSSQQAGLAQDVVGTRVLLAARSGLDWGIYQVINTTASPGNFRGNCNGNVVAPVALSGLQGMPGITVVVSCSSVAYNEGAGTLRSYQIVATACNNANCPNPAPSAQYVERRLTALIVN